MRTRRCIASVVASWAAVIASTIVTSRVVRVDTRIYLVGKIGAVRSASSIGSWVAIA
jgi:hypothetical protein